MNGNKIIVSVPEDGIVLLINELNENQDIVVEIGIIKDLKDNTFMSVCFGQGFDVYNALDNALEGLRSNLNERLDILQGIDKNDK